MKCVLLVFTLFVLKINNANASTFNIFATQCTSLFTNSVNTIVANETTTKTKQPSQNYFSPKPDFVVSKKIDDTPLTVKEVEDKLKDLVKKFFDNSQDLSKATTENNSGEVAILNSLQQEVSHQINEIMTAQYSMPDFKNHLNKLRIEELERIRKEYDARAGERAEAEESTRQRKLREDEVRKERKRQREEASDPIHQAKVNEIIFHEIAPGEFMMGEVGQRVKTVITQPFAMMQTLFTQMMYSRLMIAFGETYPAIINPSKFKTGEDSVEVNFNGVTYSMKPDHPVEQVSWYDLRGDAAPDQPPSPESFLGKLNKLSKSEDSNDQALLKKLIPGHKKGDIYDLPTNAQTEFVMRNRGNANNEFFDRQDSTELKKYAWYDENSKTAEYPEGSTHAVATLDPRMIDVNGDGNKQPFYDLEGNVKKWSKDSWNGRAPLIKGTDPLSTLGSRRVIRGGGWLYDAQKLRSGFRSSYLPGARTNDVGFRLVRARP